MCSLYLLTFFLLTRYALMFSEPWYHRFRSSRNINLDVTGPPAVPADPMLRQSASQAGLHHLSQGHPCPLRHFNLVSSEPFCVFNAVGAICTVRKKTIGTFTCLWGAERFFLLLTTLPRYSTPLLRFLTLVCVMGNYTYFSDLRLLIGNNVILLMFFEGCFSWCGFDIISSYVDIGKTQFWFIWMIFLRGVESIFHQFKKRHWFYIGDIDGMCFFLSKGAYRVFLTQNLFFFFFNRNCLVCFMIHTFPRGVLGAFFINFWNIIYITPFSLPCTVLYNRTFSPKGSIGSEHMGKRGGSRRDDGGHTLLGQYQQHGALSQQSGELLLYFFVKSVFMSE